LQAIYGVSIRTFRYWEELNLLNPTRTNGGKRVFSDLDCETIEKIQALKKQRYSMIEIKEILKIGPKKEVDWESFFLEKTELEGLFYRDVVEKKIKRLSRTGTHEEAENLFDFILASRHIFLLSKYPFPSQESPLAKSMSNHWFLFLENKNNTIFLGSKKKEDEILHLVAKQLLSLQKKERYFSSNICVQGLEQQNIDPPLLDVFDRFSVQYFPKKDSFSRIVLL